MSLKLLCASLLSGLLILNANIVFAAGKKGGGGGADTGGADDFQDLPAKMWVKEKTPALVCLNVSSDFGVSKKDAGEELLRALNTWNEYYSIRGSRRIDPRDEQKNLLNFVIQDKCDSNTNIRFELGDVSEDMSKGRIANTKLLQYNEQTRIGHGVVEVRKQSEVPKYIVWSKPNRLLAILLHEIGHVLGCGHVPNTIMAEDVTKYIEVTEEGLRDVHLQYIDMAYELLPANAPIGVFYEDNKPVKMVCSKANYQGTPVSADVAPGEFEPAIEKLIGRASSGQWQMNLTNNCNQLVYQDNKGTLVFEVNIGKPLRASADSPMPAGVFGGSRFAGETVFSSIRTGKLSLGEKSIGTIEMKSNIGQSPRAIDFVDADGNYLPLFRAVSPIDISYEKMDIYYGSSYSIK